MKILYIFPHPDDESFGPAPAMAAQRRQGDEVYLLTLTKGEATKQRHRLGVDKAEMGAIRYQEMQSVEKVLDLSGMSVLDLPDSGLKEMNPIRIEEVIRLHIRQLQPDIVVTYAVHGISGFHDHLVTHAVVKRVYCQMKTKGIGYPRRLAFFTLGELEERERKFNLSTSSAEEIDCIVQASDEDMRKFNASLDCYETYKQVIEESKVREDVNSKVCFEIFQETFDPPLVGLTEKLR